MKKKTKTKEKLIIWSESHIIIFCMLNDRRLVAFCGAKTIFCSAAFMNFRVANKCSFHVFLRDQQPGPASHLKWC